MANKVQTVPDLGTALNAILAAELAAGNKIVRPNLSGGWPTIVLLDRPFLCDHTRLSESIYYREMSGPAPWKGHYINLETGNVLACKPASRNASRPRGPRRKLDAKQFAERADNRRVVSAL
jgi:hypothetical protein